MSEEVNESKFNSQLDKTVEKSPEEGDVAKTPKEGDGTTFLTEKNNTGPPAVSDSTAVRHEANEAEKGNKLKHIFNESTTLSEDSTTRSGSDKVSSQQQTADADLDELLDDALQDFDGAPNVKGSGASVSKEHKLEPHSGDASHRTGEPSARPPVAQSDSESHAASNPSQDAMFNEIFERMSQHPPPQNAAEMESFIMSLMKGVDPQGQLFSSTDLGNQEGGASSGDLANTLEQTIGSLAQNAQELLNDNMSEDDLIRMMSSLGGGSEGGGLLGAGGEDDDGELMPMMHGMMKNLLSRDVLYPSLKEISVQYPAWLDSHKDNIDRKDYEKYELQYKLMTAITDEFDAERVDDSDDVKRLRFERILGIMQQMQELGHPPKEIVGEIPNGLDVDENGVPRMFSGLGSADQCSVM